VRIAGKQSIFLVDVTDDFSLRTAVLLATAGLHDRVQLGA
jgi:hypothetical protein